MQSLKKNIDDSDRIKYGADKYDFIIKTPRLLMNLVRFAPPAIARHERAGHNWNNGLMELTFN